MTKAYISPKMMAVLVAPAAILCLSAPNMLDIHEDEPVSEEDNEYSDYEGYGEAW